VLKKNRPIDELTMIDSFIKNYSLKERGNPMAAGGAA
jgi:hypothetical protein